MAEVRACLVRVAEQQPFAFRVDKDHLALDGGALVEVVVGHRGGQSVGGFLKGHRFVAVGRDLLLKHLNVHQSAQVAIPFGQRFQLIVVELGIVAVDAIIYLVALGILKEDLISSFIRKKKVSDAE